MPFGWISEAVIWPERPGLQAAAMDRDWDRHENLMLDEQRSALAMFRARKAQILRGLV
jgi:hypothetical protein